MIARAAAAGVAIAALLSSACEDPKPRGGASSAPPLPTQVDPRKVDDAQIPQLDVPRAQAGDTITIDGVLDEPLWTRAGKTGRFVDAGSGKARDDAPVQGSARLAWDDTFLYVAVEVDDAKIRGGFPADAIDPHLWERDTVELMLDPDGDGDNRDYYEIQVSPQNLVFDSQFDDYNAPRPTPNGPFGHQEWRAELTSAIKIRGTIDDDSDRDEGYVVEMKIPWKSFTKAKEAPPKPGATWRANLYAMQDNGGVAWSPILGKGNFHKASRFGRLRFR